MFRDPRDHRRRRLLGLRTRFLVGALLIALTTATAVAAVAIGAVTQIAADLGRATIHSHQLTPAHAGAPETILVVGDDHDGPLVHGVHLLHADTFMLVHMDPTQGQTSIMSIPRDLLVSFSWKGAEYTDQKFNTTYAVGGVGAVLKVAKRTLPGVTINHVIDFNFASFIGVVRAIGCVYIDVDRRYLNLTDQSYSAINLEPGYQRLCANNALSYVRYRHTDSDFVRVARQQDFIRQAKEQLGTFNLITKYDQIARALGHAIHTDITGIHDVNALLQLIAYSSSRPIRHVAFQYSNAQYFINGEEAVTSTPSLIRASVDQFLNAAPPAHAPGAAPPVARHGRRSHEHHHHHHAATPASIGLIPRSSGVADQALALAPQLPFPLYLPTEQTVPAQPNDFHVYTVTDEQGHAHTGYRIDWQQNGVGGYYGIEGMDWTDPPLFADPSATETIGGRTYLFIDDGSHFHDIGWRTGKALYWVSNTLLEDLTNQQMLAIAESSKPLTLR
ncbi:MAG: LCP family protein [Solirubrobacteraceae bacterium]